MSKPEAKEPEIEKTAGEEPAAEDTTEEVAEVAEEAADAPAEESAEDVAEDVAEEAEERDPEAEIADLNDKLLRALAETENLRRRSQKERQDTANYAVSSFARDLLTVADNLGRALGALPEDSAETPAETPAGGADETDGGLSGFIEGVRLTERELAAVLERHGIARLDPMGQKFDPNLHEAMFEIPTGEAAPGTVVQVLEAGYVLKERLLRAAKVGVARALPEGEKGERVDTTA